MDIDKIFAAAKKKGAQSIHQTAKTPPKGGKAQPIDAKQTGSAPPQKKIQKQTTRPAKPTRPTASRFTEDGFKIMGHGDLKLGQGGNTKDCPFDCECCF